MSDNATSFTSEEFQEWCSERGITHLSGAPYHPATNGAAERLVQSFKSSLRKSSLPPKSALQEFLMIYRCTPLPSGMSPSELLNGRQIRTKIDVLVPSHLHIAQGMQCDNAYKSGKESPATISKVLHEYKVGRPVYVSHYKSPYRKSWQTPRRQKTASTHHVSHYGRKIDKTPRWVPAIVSKRLGTRHLLVKVLPQGPVWKRHIEQVRPRCGADQETDPGETASSSSSAPLLNPPSNPTCSESVERPMVSGLQLQSQTHDSPPYGLGNPRRSKRIRRPVARMDL